MTTIERDFTRGPLKRQMLHFSLPLIFTNLLQILFNLTDIAVVGRFAGSLALGAVGSTSTLVALFTALLLGMGSGTGIVIARCLGARSDRDTHEAVHTAFLLSVSAGTAMMLLGIGLAEMLLRLMHTRDEMLADAVRYLRIYCLGLPGVAMYNFGKAVFSAMGEARRPFLILLAAGVLNVALNLVTVIVLHMGVTGVAIASVVSQYVSCALVIRLLMRHKGSCAFQWKRVHLYWSKGREILSLGVISGLQESAFAIANLYLQTAVNSFDADTVAGHTAALNADTITFAIMFAFWTASQSLMGQNLGAGNRRRFHQAYGTALLYTFLTGVVCGSLLLLFGREFLSLFTNEPAVVERGLYRLYILGASYPLCVLQDTSVHALHTLGKKLVPTVISLFSIIVFRTIWLLTVFAHYQTLLSLYLLYPCSFVISGILDGLYLWRCDRKYWNARAALKPASGHADASEAD